MKKIYSWTIIIIISFSIIFAFSFTGCAPEEEPFIEDPIEEEPFIEEPLEPSEKEWEIVFVPRVMEGTFFDRTEQGLTLASEAFEINAYQRGDIDVDPHSQVTIIEDLIASEVDAILVTPVDPVVVEPVLQRAMEEGILTISYGSPVHMDAVTWDIRALDDEAFGRHIWDLLVEHMGESGDYAVLIGHPEIPEQAIWFDAGISYAEEQYPDLNLVRERIPTEESFELAYDATIDLIEAFPEVEGIIGLGLMNPPGIASAIRDSNLIDEIAVVGTSLPQMSAEYLKDGSLNAATLWDPLWESYTSAYIAKTELEGEEIYDGMECPGYDVPLQVEENIIIPCSWIVFTEENVDEFPF